MEYASYFDSGESRNRHKTFREISDLRYKIEDEFAKEWACRYGIIDFVTNLRMCLRNEWGYIGHKRIDINYTQSLCESDRQIIEEVYQLSGNKNR